MTDKIHWWVGHGSGLCGESCWGKNQNHLNVIKTLRLCLDKKDVTCEKCLKILNPISIFV